MTLFLLFFDELDPAVFYISRYELKGNKVEHSYNFTVKRFCVYNTITCFGRKQVIVFDGVFLKLNLLLFVKLLVDHGGKADRSAQT
jgi:hypothetical protein